MTLPGAAAPSTRHEVEHLFGRCLLQFQAFELLMKRVVERHRLSGSKATLEDAQTRRINETRRKTMGVLVDDMMGTVLVAAGQEGLQDAREETSGPSFALCLQLSIPPEDYARIEAEHRALVALRNSLVHHFLDEHDLCSEAGCLGAKQALTAALDRANRACSDLREWAAETEQAGKAMAEILASAEVSNWIAGGRIPWHATTIVRALLNAHTELAAGDWASVETASEWVTAHHPDERPEGYGCRTWRQVIHHSGLFELQVRKLDGRRRAWYRPRASKPGPP